MRFTVPAVIVGTVCLCAAGPLMGLAHAKKGGDPDLACRSAIAKGVGAAAKAALASVKKCYKRSYKTGGSCTNVDAAVGKMQALVGKAVKKGCKKQTCQLAVYGGDPVATIVAGMQRRFAAALQPTLGAPSGLDRKKIRCHSAIVAAFGHVAPKTLGAAAACESGAGRKCAPMESACFVPDGEEESFSRQDIRNACGSLTGADVGACASQPDCTIDGARSLGFGLAREAFTATECGNGKLEGGEECDDGNTDDTDACSNSCKHPICGDGIVQSGAEQCDDANRVNTDDCTEQCKLNVCGDGFKKTTEECDDGNVAGGDGCSPTCQFEGLACGPNGLNVTVVFGHSVTDNMKSVEFNLSYPAARAALPGSGQYTPGGDPPNNDALGARLTQLQPDAEADDLLIANDQDVLLPNPNGLCNPNDQKGACPRVREVYVQGPPEFPPVIDPGPFATFRFDCLGGTFLPADFPCLLTGPCSPTQPTGCGSDPNGQPVAASCSVTLAPAP